MKTSRSEIQESILKIAHYCVYKEMMTEVDETQAAAIPATDYKVMMRLLKKVLDSFGEAKPKIESKIEHLAVPARPANVAIQK